jgi:hypothetical protein
MKKVIFTLSCILITTTIFGQWFAEAGYGIALPIHTNNELYNNYTIMSDVFTHESFTKKESTKFNIIQSPFLTIKGGNMINEKLLLSLNLMYSNNEIFKINRNNTTKIEYISRTINGTDSIESKTEYSEYYYSKVLTISPSFAYNISLTNSLSFEPSIGVDFNLINMIRIDSSKTEQFYYKSGEKFSESYIIRKNKFPFSYRFKNAFNLSTGFNILYDLNKNITFSLTGMIDIFNTQYSPETQIIYYQKEIINEETIKLDENEYLDEVQGLYEPLFMNRYRISLGVRYTFGSSKDTKEDD